MRALSTYSNQAQQRDMIVKIIVAFYTSVSFDFETQLKDHAQTHLADYKRPKAYVRLDALPQNANGKINRNALRQMKDLIT